MDGSSNASGDNNRRHGNNDMLGVDDDDDDANMSGDDMGNDAEGVWSPDIEQSFQEALAIYPPCGRRKIILSDEGKMYGRNELIARYIKLRTGKMRSRKQVSSHIQVMARRKAKEIQAQLKDQGTREWVVQSMSAMSSAQIVSAAALGTKQPSADTAGGPLAANTAGSGISLLARSVKLSNSPVAFSEGLQQQPWLSNAFGQDIKPLHGMTSSAYGSSLVDNSLKPQPAAMPSSADVNPPWQSRSIAGPRLRLLEFSAFLEQQLQPDTDAYNKHLFVHIGGNVTYADPLLEAVDIRQIADKFPDKRGGLKELYDKGPQAAFFLVKFWADINVNVQNEAGAFYGVTSLFESASEMTIQCSTKVCSFGKQVVEKVESEFGHAENGRYIYCIHRSPMCEYMINFILKLKHLPEKYMMNSVLENFTILQVVVNSETQETLLCIAYVFEVSSSVHGAQHHIYRLVKD